MRLKSTFLSEIPLTPKILAPAKAGIDKKKDIFAESTLLNPKILLAVITIPDLLTPGMIAKTWNNPIIRIFLKFKLLSILFFAILLSAKNNTIPKINVVHATNFKFLNKYKISK